MSSSIQYTNVITQDQYNTLVERLEAAALNDIEVDTLAEAMRELECVRPALEEIRLHEEACADYRRRAAAAAASVIVIR